MIMLSINKPNASNSVTGLSVIMLTLSLVVMVGCQNQAEKQNNFDQTADHVDEHDDAAFQVGGKLKTKSNAKTNPGAEGNNSSDVAKAKIEKMNEKIGSEKKSVPLPPDLYNKALMHNTINETIQNGPRTEKPKNESENTNNTQPSGYEARRLKVIEKEINDLRQTKNSPTHSQIAGWVREMSKLKPDPQSPLERAIAATDGSFDAYNSALESLKNLMNETGVSSSGPRIGTQPTDLQGVQKYLNSINNFINYAQQVAPDIKELSKYKPMRPLDYSPTAGDEALYANLDAVLGQQLRKKYSDAFVVSTNDALNDLSKAQNYVSREKHKLTGPDADREYDVDNRLNDLAKMQAQIDNLRSMFANGNTNPNNALNQAITQTNANPFQ